MRHKGKCNCPTSIPAGRGPYLAVLGAAITDKDVVRRPTGLERIGMGHCFEDKHIYRIARIFGPIRKAL